MLRITTARDDGDGLHLRLEGRLVGEWVVLLEETCRRHAVEDSRPLRLEVSDVRFVSPEGARLLCRLRRSGVACTGLTPLVRSLCERINTSEPPGAPSRDECADRP